MPDALQSLLLLVAAYLLGSVSVRPRWDRLPAGVAREGQAAGHPQGGHASGHKRRRIAEVTFDLARGGVAAWAGLHLAPPSAEYAGATAHAYAAALAVALGHTWPLWRRLRGELAVAPLAGAVLVLWPWVVPVLLAAWGLALLATGAPVVATASAGLALVLAAWWSGAALPRFAFAAAAAVLVLAGERLALLQWVRGEAPRFAAARLLLRLRRGPR